MEQLQRDIDFLVKFTQHFANAVVCPVAREIPEKIKKELDENLRDIENAKKAIEHEENSKINVRYKVGCADYRKRFLKRVSDKVAGMKKGGVL